MLAQGHIYRDAFQEVDQQSLFTPVTKKTWTAPSADRVPELFREAFRTALSPRQGPVQLNLPRDVLAAQGIQRAWINGHINNGGFSTSQRRLDRGADIVQPVRPEPCCAIKFSQFIKRRAGHIRTDIASIEEVALIRFFRAPAFVVHHDRHGIDPVIHRRR